MLNVRQTQGERRVYALLVFCIELPISAWSSGFSGKTPVLSVTTDISRMVCVQTVSRRFLEFALDIGTGKMGDRSWKP